ncbi:MAG: hypothetical protein HEQ16_05165 [Bosea sp.]|jgi:hypothetical protein|nr:hypothetical protein [Bosea sp. (in: a-proteobacteria)]
MQHDDPSGLAPLSTRLRHLRGLMRRYVHSHQRPTVDACRELVDQLTDMAEAAQRLEIRADDADALEAVARDLDLITHAGRGGPSSSFRPPAISEKRGEIVELRSLLARQQAELQAALDAGDADAAAALIANHAFADVTEMVLAGPDPRSKGAAETDHRRSASVVVLPVVQRTRHGHDGGDAA